MQDLLDQLEQLTWNKRPHNMTEAITNLEKKNKRTDWET